MDEVNIVWAAILVLIMAFGAISSLNDKVSSNIITDEEEDIDDD